MKNLNLIELNDEQLNDVDEMIDLLRKSYSEKFNNNLCDDCNCDDCGYDGCDDGNSDW